MHSKLGWQAQTLTGGARDWLIRFPPHHLKVIAPSFSAWNLLGDWRKARPDGLLVVRPYFPDEHLDPAKIDQAVAYGRTLRGLDPIIEVPINEAHQNGADLDALNIYTLQAVEALAAIGVKPAVGVFSEGNPADLADWSRFYPSLRVAKAAGGYLALHEYGVPSLGYEDWHLLRHRRVWDVLPPDCRLPILVTESGIDGGIEGRAAQGWRSYMDAAVYAAWLDRYRAELDRDLYVHASFVFLCGGYSDWARFDVAGEGDLERVFQEETNPAIWVPAAPVSSAPPPAIPGDAGDPNPSTRSVPMRAGLYYRMDADIPENSVEELGALCLSGGFEVICPKAADSNAWEGDFDHGQLALSSVETLLAQQATYGRMGIALVPWVVYRGIYPEAEAQLHGAIGAACGELIVDFEWGYAGFADHGTFDDALSYFILLRSLTPGVAIHFNPDPRQITQRAYDATRIYPYVNTVLPQSYWTDFGEQWQSTLSAGINLPTGSKPCYQVLPGDSSTADLVAAVTYLRDRGDAQVYVFQRTGLVPGDFARLKEVLSVPTAPTPQPTPDQEVAQIRDTVWAAATRLEQLGYPWMAQGLKATVTLSKGEK